MAIGIALIAIGLGWWKINPPFYPGVLISLGLVILAGISDEAIKKRGAK